jgi:hypothetical protein
MQFFQDMPEYCDMMEFHRQNRKEIAKLYQALANASESEYIEYTELLQRMSLEMAVNLVFDMLKKQGIVKDRR